jgi:EmrB/QacA subfamily drug resistance transporter
MKGLSYKWLVLSAVIFGLFMVIMDLTIVNIAVPNLQTDFGASLSDVSWVSTGYSLAEGIGIPLTPYFSALLGNKRFYLLLLALFTTGSALCGLAWSLPALIFFRIVQGLAGAGMIPMSITLLYSEFPPEERGIAMGTLGVPLMVAPALGPTVGGYLVTFVSWRVIFYINVPIGILGFFMGAIILRNIRAAGQRTPSFDLVGFLFCSLGLGAMLYAFDKAGSKGWGSLTVESFLAIGIISLVIFVIVELTTIENGRQPLLDLRVFGTRTFAGSNIALATIVFAMFGGQFLVPQYLQNLRSLSAYDAGLVLLPQALGSMVASLIGGRLVDKLGVKAVVLPGLLILGSALWGLSHITLQTPFSTFQVFLILRGLGIGLSMQPTTVAALAETKPAQLSQASSVNSVVRSVMTSFAVAIVTTLVTARTAFHSVRLAEQVTPDSMAGQTLQQQAAYLVTTGMTQQQATFVAMEEMVLQLKQQAYLLAMNDAFLVTLGTIFLTIFIVLFVVRTPRRKGTALPNAEHMVPSEEPVRKEEQAVSVAREVPASVNAQTNTALHERRAATVADKPPITAPAQTNNVLQKRRKELPKRRLLRRSVVLPALILTAILISGVIGYLLYNSYYFYATDDAQVTGTMVNVTPPTSGTLISLDVQVGTLVSARQIIGTVVPLSSLAPVQHLVAPMNGVIVQVPGSVGQIVSTSSIIAQETDPQSMKITTYVDESAINNVAVGQAVDIHVDAYNTTLTGHITQIVGATADQFALLPTSNNSSGNYTKVSQRIPVYVQLDNPADKEALLPGMSVEVTIHLH